MVLEDLLLETGIPSDLEAVTFPDGTRLTLREFETLVAILSEMRDAVADIAPEAGGWFAVESATLPDLPQDLTSLELDQLIRLPVQSAAFSGTNEAPTWLDQSRLADLDAVDLINLPIQQFVRDTEIERLEFLKFLKISLRDLLSSEVVAARAEPAPTDDASGHSSIGELASLELADLMDVPVWSSPALDQPLLTSRPTNIAAFDPYVGDGGGGSEVPPDFASPIEVATSEVTSPSAPLFAASISRSGGSIGGGVASAGSIGPVGDTDATPNLVSESVANGASAGVAAFATDPDPGDIVSYSLINSAGGRFAINGGTGVITVANTSLLDYETATSHTVTVRATSTDGSTSDQSFMIGLSDDTTEFGVGAVGDVNAAADSVSESAVNTSVVGVTAQATDGDATDAVSYSLTDSAGGRFAIDSNTGVITVANTSLLNYEAVTSHDVAVRATSTDGSTSDRTFTIAVTDDTSEFSVGAVSDVNAAANSVSESAANTTAVGVTASASDADGTDTVSYSLTDSAGGRFTIDSSTGVITVANTSLLNYEAATSHDVTVRATSTDGSTSDRTFTIALTDDTSEFSVGAVSDVDATANSVSESAANTTVVGITASASDADATDTVSYSLTDSAGGRFAINSGTGVITVANTSLIDYETATNHTVTVRATSTDGSTSDQNFVIAIADDTSEASISAITTTTSFRIDTTNYTQTTEGFGVTARNIDGGGNLTTASLGNVFAGGSGLGVSGSTGASAPADQLGYDAIWGVSEQLIINLDNPMATASVSVNLLLAVEGPSGEEGHWEAFRNGVSVGQGDFTPPSGSSMTFTIDPGPGLAFDQLIFTANTYIGGQGGITDNSSDYLIASIDYTPGVLESAANGTAVGITAVATDADLSDTVSYSLTDSAGGRFAIDSTTGVITVANGSLLDYESVTSHDVTVQATSTDGSTSSRTFTIAVLDAAEGTAGSDTMNGTVGDDGLDGLAGSDTINGLAGNDSLYGGNDSDILNGGDGNDLLDGGSDSGSDTLNGDAGNDTLIGGAGSDNLDGGTGVDTADYSAAGGVVTADLSAGSATDGDGGSDNLTNIENLIGSAFGDTLTGDGGANSLSGGGGADTLNAGAGNDLIDWDSADLVINGGTGDDTLRVTTGNADITTYAGTMQGIENIDLSADSGANSLTISAQDVLDISDTDTVTVIGDAGDSLSAGSGWTDGGVDGDGNQIYTQMVMGNLATLLVDPDVAVNADILL